MPLPVVTPRDLHMSRLNPAVLRIDKRRANAAARRKYLPVLRNDRAAFGTANRAYRTEAGSVRGAIGMTENALGQARRQARHSGLQGGYLRQVLHELDARQVDTARSAPMLLADAASTRAAAIAKARTNLLTDRAGLQSYAGSTFNSTLASDRLHAASALKSQASANKPSTTQVKALKNAAIALKDFLVHWSADPALQQQNPLSTPDHWRTLAVGLDHQYAGFDLADAMKITGAFLQRRQRQANQVAAGRGHLSQGSLRSFPVFSAR